MIFRKHFISVVCIFSYSAVRVHDSQAYKNMKMIRERISRIIELSMMLEFQIGLSLISAAVV